MNLNQTLKIIKILGFSQTQVSTHSKSKSSLITSMCCKVNKFLKPNKINFKIQLLMACVASATERSAHK